LTFKDIEDLHCGWHGSITFDDNLFEQCINISPPEYFHTQLRDLIITVTRDKEAGSRLLIGHYMCHAVLIARGALGKPRLVLNSEVEVEAVEVPKLGRLGGTLDFVTSIVAGDGIVGTPLASCL